MKRTTHALPVAGERYKRDGLTREVEDVSQILGCVTYRIRFGDQDEIHHVSLGTWNKWAEKAKKEAK